MSMHLRDARVDLDGMIVTLGRIAYPDDGQGHFPQVVHQELRIRVRPPWIYGGLMRLAIARSRRDSQSGFLVSEEIGPVVFVPVAITAAIRQALERRLDEPAQISLSRQEGTLESGPNRETSIKQPLSGWLLRLAEEDTGLHVQLSADLHATLPAPSYQKDRTVNFWTNSSVKAPRISIDFHVDLVTRAACFGCYSGNWPSAPEHTDAEVVQTTLRNLRLDCAPIGSNWFVYGIAPGDQWVWFSDDRRREVSFALMRSQQRSSAGFLVGSNKHTSPTVTLNGIDLEIVGAMLGQDRNSCSMELNGGWFGSLQLTRDLADLSPRPDQSIIKALLEFQLEAKGLNLAYRILVNDLHLNPRPYRQGWLQGSFTLPWELLILRYPTFLQHRQYLPKEET